MNRDLIQAEAIAAWEEANGVGTLAMATGVGKSKIAIDICEKLQKDKKDIKILLVVPTQQLRDTNWDKEFKKWGKEHLLANIDKVCYVSLTKKFNKVYDLVILDESHKITPNNSKFFLTNIALKVLSLTATFPLEEDRAALLNDVAPMVFEYTLDEAVKDGAVAPYEIFVIQTQLEEEEKGIKAGSKDKPFYQSEKKAYEYVNGLIAKARLSDDSKLQMLLLKRMRLIYNLPSKVRAAERLLKYLKEDERILIFTGSIDHADKLCDHRYHSKTNDTALNRFVNGELTRLSCVKALNEGINVPDLDIGVVVQLDSKVRNAIQRIGRIVRYRKDHVAKIFLIVCEETQDKVWCENALKGIDENKITYVNVNRLP